MSLSSYQGNEHTALPLTVALGSSRVPSLPTQSLVSCAGGEQAVHVSCSPESSHEQKVTFMADPLTA